MILFVLHVVGVEKPDNVDVTVVTSEPLFFRRPNTSPITTPVITIIDRTAVIKITFERLCINCCDTEQRKTKHENKPRGE